MTQCSKRTARGDKIDRVGAIASIVCAVHCAVCALAPAALAGLGLTALLDHETEWGLTLAAILLAAAAFVARGWRRIPTSTLLVFGMGMSGLLLARYLEEAGAHGLGTMLGVVAALAIVAGHVLNLQTSRE